MQTAAENPKPRKHHTITDVVDGAPTPAPKKSPPSAAPVVPSKFVPSQLLDIELIEPDPENPRKDFPKEEMQQLTSSILLRGVEQAIEVRPIVGGRFRITFGERRWRGAKAAGLKQIPATVKPRTDLDAADVQLAENLDRADLSPLEIAGGYQRQITLGRTMEQVCERAGKKRSAVYSTIALLKLGPEGRKALGEELLEAETAKLLVKYVPKSMQAEQVKTVTGQGKDHWDRSLDAMSYREALHHLTGFVVDLKKAPFDVKSEALPCVAKSCAVCPNRAGNNPDLYGDVKPDVCVDREKYAGKLHLFRKAELEKKGVKLLTPEEAPVDEIFWNTHDGLREDSGYVEPKASCDKDARRRSYAELLEPEQLTKLTAVALNHRGDPVELLKRAGLEKELKKAGKLTSWEQQTKTREATRKKKAKVEKEQGPKLAELTRDVVMGRCVAAIEDKGHLTSAMLKLLACKLLGAIQWDQRLETRRGVRKDSLWGLDAKKLDKVFPKMTPGKLAGLVFEAAFDDAFEVCDVDDMDSGALDACELLGVNVQKVAGEVKAQRDAQKAKSAEKAPAKEKKPAPAKKATKKGGGK